MQLCGILSEFSSRFIKYKHPVTAPCVFDTDTQGICFRFSEMQWAVRQLQCKCQNLSADLNVLTFQLFASRAGHTDTNGPRCSKTKDELQLESPLFDVDGKETSVDIMYYGIVDVCAGDMSINSTYWHLSVFCLPLRDMRPSALPWCHVCP